MLYNVYSLYLNYMNLLGKKRVIVIKITFLRYLTHGSGMISGSFSCYPIEKKIFYRYVISF